MIIKIVGPCTIKVAGDIEIDAPDIIIDGLSSDPAPIPEPTPPPVVTKPPANAFDGFIAVDIHCHLNGCPVVFTPEELLELMKLGDLDLITPLAWGYFDGNRLDLPLLTGEDHPVSTPTKIIHIDAEYSQTPSSIFGHMVIHGVTAHPLLIPKSGKPSASTIPIADWAHQRGAVIGMAHCSTWSSFPSTPGDVPGYPGTERVQFAPYEAPILSILGLLDYLSVEGTNRDGKCLHPGPKFLWSHLNKAGFKVGLVGSSDFTCISSNKELGTMRTMVQTGGEISYAAAMDGIRNHRTVISTGKNGILNLTVDGKGLGETNSVPKGIRSTIAIETDQPGPVVLTLDGQDLTTIPIINGKGNFVVPWGWTRSTFIAASTPDYQTSAVYIEVDGKPQSDQASLGWLLGWVNRLEEAVTNGVFGEGAKDGLPYYVQAKEILKAKMV